MLTVVTSSWLTCSVAVIVVACTISFLLIYAQCQVCTPCACQLYQTHCSTKLAVVKVVTLLHEQEWLWILDIVLQHGGCVFSQATFSVCVYVAGMMFLGIAMNLYVWLHLSQFDWLEPLIDSLRSGQLHHIPCHFEWQVAMVTGTAGPQSSLFWMTARYFHLEYTGCQLTLQLTKATKLSYTSPRHCEPIVCTWNSLKTFYHSKMVA